MDIDITILQIFIAMSFALIGVGYIMKFSIPMSLFIFIAGGLMLALFVMIDNITIDYFPPSSDIAEVEYYDVSFGNAVLSLFLGGTIAGAEFVSTSSSALVDDKIQCIDMPIRRVNNPDNLDMVRVGTLDSLGLMVKTFGTIDPTALSTAYKIYTFCLDEGQEHIIQTGDRIGIRYASGNFTNVVEVRGDNTNPFDSTVTFRQTFTAGWASATSIDHSMRLYDLTDNAVRTADYEFTEELKVFMMLMAVSLMLTGAAIEIQSRRG